MQFPNGARIQLFGADYYDSIRGRHFSGIVIDEVAQMKREVWTMVIQPALANKRGWALFIGTPNGINLFSELYGASQSDPEWYHKILTAYDTDVYTPEEIVKMRKPAPIGMGERAFRQEMLCDFMASSDDSLISLEAVNAAYGRILRDEEYAYAPRVIGVDVAWQGGDRSVIFPRQGLAAFKPVVRLGLPEKQFAAELADIWARWKPDAVFVDNTGGYGGEVISRLTDNGYNPQGVKFSEGPIDARFLNKRAEMWFKMADWVKGGGSISEDEENGSALKSELSAVKYDNDNVANKLKLESKADVKERLGFSPDLADALCLTFAFPVLSRQEYRGIEALVKFAQKDWNPIPGVVNP